jgi:hypothetical protein
VHQSISRNSRWLLIVRFSVCFMYNKEKDSRVLQDLGRRLAASADNFTVIPTTTNSNHTFRQIRTTRKSLREFAVHDFLIEDHRNQASRDKRNAHREMILTQKRAYYTRGHRQTFTMHRNRRELKCKTDK